MKYISGLGLNLQDDRVQIIENIIPENELNILREMMWNYLNHLTKNCELPIDKTNPDSYRTFFELYPKHGMLLQHWDVGHNPMSWYVRQHPNVIKCFENIWQTNDLLVSFDGLSISLPCEITKRGWYRDSNWLHVDQSYTRNDFECVQGLINLYDVNEGDATLRLLRGSHLYHKKFRDEYNISSVSDWYKLNPEELQFYTTKCEDIALMGKAGSIYLWDSRTVHQGLEPCKGRSVPNIRCALYVCMTPKILSNQANLNKKKKAFLEKRTSSHYPHKIKLFPKHPRTYGGPLPVVNPYIFKETDLMKKLSGF